MHDIVIYNQDLSEKVVLRTDLIDSRGIFTVMWISGITEALSGKYQFKQGTVTSVGEISVFIAEQGLSSHIESANLKTPIQPATPYLNNLSIGFVVDRETYYSLLPKHYTDRYTWEEDPNIRPSLPWIIMYWDKVVSNSEMRISIKHNGTQVEFANIAPTDGTVSDDNTEFITTLPMDVFFDISTQLQITPEEGEYEVTATIGGITKTFKATL